MSTLQQIAQTNPEWDLETFVQIANDLLPQYLPALEDNRNRSPDVINPRLVRYYTTQGVLNRPLRQGRESRYTYRHLLQLLIVRRLLVEGYSTTAIQSITHEKENIDLEALLQGGVQLTVEAANPALAFLQSVKSRTAPILPVADKISKAQPPSPAPSRQSAPFANAETQSQPSYAVSDWQRVEVLPGLEVQVRDDFVPPGTPQEYENLLQLIAQRLNPLFQSRRSSP